MAYQKTYVGNLSRNAGMDLRSYQYYPVQAFPSAGVLLVSGDAGSHRACHVYVLGNRPNSGQAAELINAPNVTKAYLEGTVVDGTPMTWGASGAGFANTSLGLTDSAHVIMGIAQGGWGSGDYASMLLK